MRKLWAVAIAAMITLTFTLSVSKPAEAGIRKYMICWMTPSGVSDCAWLPRNYRLYWVRKPFCNAKHRCWKGTVRFALTRKRIAYLSRYVDTTSMFPTHTATIYAPK
ncbi:MAG: hypothetical protein RIC14_12380 [Filomicrobium sp.]